MPALAILTIITAFFTAFAPSSGSARPTRGEVLAAAAFPVDGLQRLAEDLRQSMSRSLLMATISISLSSDEAMTQTDRSFAMTKSLAASTSVFLSMPFEDYPSRCGRLRTFSGSRLGKHSLLYILRAASCHRSSPLRLVERVDQVLRVGALTALDA